MAQYSISLNKRVCQVCQRAPDSRRATAVKLVERFPCGQERPDLSGAIRGPGCSRRRSSSNTSPDFADLRHPFSKQGQSALQAAGV